MKILLINTNNPYAQAGTVALDLFNQLKEHGHEVRLLINSYIPHIQDIVSMQTYVAYWSKRKFPKLHWGISRLKLLLGSPIPTDPNYCFFSIKEQGCNYNTDRLLKKAKLLPDAIIILFAKDFINTKNMYELYKRTQAPIYWLMYDMAPITGGCHYAWDCKGYQNECGNCPGLFSSAPFDFSYRNLSYKRTFIKSTNIHLITASELQYRQAKSSSIFLDKPIHKILTSINPDIFKPSDKEELRSRMGIRRQKKVIFFGSVDLTEKRKGMGYFIDSLHILKEILKDSPSYIQDNILLLCAGGGFEQFISFIPFEYHYLGMLGNTKEIASAFRAADVFVCPSIEDSGPTMINQSIMCGTPVVAFDMGVALDLVLTGQTGYRAKNKDSGDLAQGLYNILTLDSDQYRIYSNNCRELALKLYHPDVNYNSWISILNKSK